MSDDFLDDDDADKASIKDQWEAGGLQSAMGELSEEEALKVGARKGQDAKLPLYFKPDDFDLYANKETGEVYVFHGPDLPHALDKMEIKEDDSRINVYTKDGQKFDLGIRVGWLLRPYVKQAKTIYVVQTKNGEAIEGFEVPISLKERSE